eukprot:scaffold60387_cov70-Phaeocystis_antarctica.AAC.2
MTRTHALTTCVGSRLALSGITNVEEPEVRPGSCAGSKHSSAVVGPTRTNIEDADAQDAYRCVTSVGVARARCVVVSKREGDAAIAPWRSYRCRRRRRAWNDAAQQDTEMESEHLGVGLQSLLHLLLRDSRVAIGDARQLQLHAHPQCKSTAWDSVTRISRPPGLVVPLGPVHVLVGAQQLLSGL